MGQEIHNIIWRSISIEITFTPERFAPVDHIELRSEAKAPLPITNTGYKSEYVSRGEIGHYSGVAAYVTAWLDWEAEQIRWDGAQLSLF